MKGNYSWKVRFSSSHIGKQSKELENYVYFVEYALE